MSQELTIVKEGWLYKRGEYIKNWRPRYFLLTSDGMFYGYKDKPNKYSSKPIDVYNLPDPLNNFSILDSQIKADDSKKENSFVIRFFQLSHLVERKFNVPDKEERDSWVEVIRKIVQTHSNIKKAHGVQNLAAKDEKDQAKKPTFNDYELVKVIGRGTFGKVVLAKTKATGDLVAIKMIKKEVILEKDELEHTITENRVLQSSQHPFLISMLASFQTKERLCFVMEFVNGGELFFHLSRERIFSEPRSRFYGAEIVLAVKYLHENKIVYRDLKLENLLLDNLGHIKIADFGLCKQDIGFGDKMKTFCGTPEYLAPEVIEDNDYGRAVDWWGLGIVMYEMMCGRLPFFNKDHELLFELILTKEVSFTNTISASGKKLISSLLIKTPKLRLGGGKKDAAEIMEHEFFDKLNWDDVLAKKLKPPFVPSTQGVSDTKYFDEEFTSEPLKLTPPTKPHQIDIDLNEEE